MQWPHQFLSIFAHIIRLAVQVLPVDLGSGGSAGGTQHTGALQEGSSRSAGTKNAERAGTRIAREVREAAAAAHRTGIAGPGPGSANVEAASKLRHRSTSNIKHGPGQEPTRSARQVQPFCHVPAFPAGPGPIAWSVCLRGK